MDEDGDIWNIIVVNRERTDNEPQIVFPIPNLILEPITTTTIHLSNNYIGYITLINHKFK